MWWDEMEQQNILTPLRCLARACVVIFSNLCRKLRLNIFYDMLVGNTGSPRQTFLQISVWAVNGARMIHITHIYARERLPFFFGFSFEIQIHFICLSLWHDAQIHFAVCVSSGKCCVSWRRETNLCLHWTCIKSLTRRMKYWFKH